MKLNVFILNLVFIYYISFINISCGTNFIIKKSQEAANPKDKAQSLMNEGKYLQAIDILEDAIEDDPQNYGLYVLCAASYAALAGFDILNIVTSMASESSEDNSTNLFLRFAQFLPSNYNTTNLNYMKKSIELLEAIPQELRSEKGDPEYGASAAYQYSIYNVYYSVMYLYLFVSFKEDGSLDINTLSTMSINDAVNIISALAKAANIEDEQNQIADLAYNTLNQISEEQGSNEKEKLISFITKK